MSEKLEKYQILELNCRTVLLRTEKNYKVLNIEELYSIIDAFDLNQCIVDKNSFLDIVCYSIRKNHALTFKKIFDSDTDIIDSSIEYFYNGVHYYDTISNITSMLNLIDIENLCNIIDELEEASEEDAGEVI